MSDVEIYSDTEEQLQLSQVFPATPESIDEEADVNIVELLEDISKQKSYSTPLLCHDFFIHLVEKYQDKDPRIELLVAEKTQITLLEVFRSSMVSHSRRSWTAFVRSIKEGEYSTILYPVEKVKQLAEAMLEYFPRWQITKVTRKLFTGDSSTKPIPKSLKRVTKEDSSCGLTMAKKAMNTSTQSTIVDFITPDADAQSLIASLLNEGQEEIDTNSIVHRPITSLQQTISTFSKDLTSTYTCPITDGSLFVKMEIYPLNSIKNMPPQNIWKKKTTKMEFCVNSKNVNQLGYLESLKNWAMDRITKHPSVQLTQKQRPSFGSYGQTW